MKSKAHNFQELTLKAFGNYITDTHTHTYTHSNTSKSIQTDERQETRMSMNTQFRVLKECKTIPASNPVSDREFIKCFISFCFTPRRSKKKKKNSTGHETLGNHASLKVAIQTLTN